jgi:hypothetical protein
MKVTRLGDGSDAKGNDDELATGMMALLIHRLVDTERQRLMDVSTERSYKSFKRERVSRMKPGHLGNLGGFGMPVLEIKQLNSLLPRHREEIGQTDKCLAFIRKHLEIMTWARGTTVHVDFGGY